MSSAEPTRPTGRAGLLRRLLKWSAICAGLALLAFCGPPLLLASAMLIGGGADEVHTIYPSPDRSASLIVVVSYEGGATVRPSSEFFLVGANFHDRVRLGGSLDARWASTNGWKDSQTLNICDRDRFSSEPEPSPTAEVVTGDGKRVTYRILAECPAGYFKAVEPKNEKAGTP